MNRGQDQMPDSHPGREVATLGGGCFWCLEAVFDGLVGVVKVESGYSGGTVKNPTYKEVCAGVTGHAEVVQIEFEPQAISYSDILDVFFNTHDPTTLNRQGADVGTQYRSIILYHNEEQKRIAQEMMEEMEASGVWNGPLVTEVAPLEVFYKAEAYHQRYFELNPEQGYCRMVVAPKVAKFRKRFSAKLKV